MKFTKITKKFFFFKKKSSERNSESKKPEPQKPVPKEEKTFKRTSTFRRSIRRLASCQKPASVSFDETLLGQENDASFGSEIWTGQEYCLQKNGEQIEDYLGFKREEPVEEVITREEEMEIMAKMRKEMFGDEEYEERIKEDKCVILKPLSSGNL
ncbi:hypothetical protein L596_008793 [Steinernema carpocapsae]|uniref:Uncharacterized protein n=1 Tax=Steinernema carpocapsae TaxID=34508 RepID=A0A4U5PDI3_STECR|nr:hypothetical protein L596_008793 [Steinernema carpocapsae]